MTKSAFRFRPFQVVSADRLAWRRTITTSAAGRSGETIKGHNVLTKTLLVVKLTILLLAVAGLAAHASGRAQNVTVSGKDLALNEVFSAIEKQTGYVVFNNKQDLAGTKSVTLSVANLPLKDLLDIIFKDQPLDYTIKDKTIFLSRKSQVVSSENNSPWSRFLTDNFNPPQPITGRITDSLGSPIEGASIRLMPGNKGASSASDGSFVIPNVDPGNYTLEISLVGHTSISRRITVTGTEPLALGSLVLRVSPEAMEDVTVVSTGYQDIPKERATGSFTKIDNKVFNEQVSTDIISRLEAVANSYSVDRRSGSSEKITIRGISTINGVRDPLIIVDNFPYEGDVNNINPNDVEDITILKDAAAASIWGTKAGNGVIVIKTKKGRFNQPIRSN